MEFTPNGPVFPALRSGVCQRLADPGLASGIQAPPADPFRPSEVNGMFVQGATAAIPLSGQQWEYLFSLLYLGHGPLLRSQMADQNHGGDEIFDQPEAAYVSDLKTAPVGCQQPRLPGPATGPRSSTQRPATCSGTLHWTTAGFRQNNSNQACALRRRTASRPWWSTDRSRPTTTAGWSRRGQGLGAVRVLDGAWTPMLG